MEIVAGKRDTWTETVKVVHTDIDEPSILFVENGVYYYDNGTDYSAVGLADYTITNLVLDSKTTIVGDYAFQSFDSIKTIDLSNCNNLTTIGVSAFAGTGITEIVLPASVKYLKKSAFTGCKDLINVDLSATQITHLNEYTFQGCTSLVNFAIPSTVTYLGACVFKNCTSLRTVYIPASVTRIAGSAKVYSPFYGCKSNLKIYCGAKSAQDGWDSYWKYYSDSSSLSTTYNYSYEQYLTLIGG